MSPMVFQSSMGVRKSRCEIPNATTQGWACLTLWPLNKCKLYILFDFLNLSVD